MFHLPMAALNMDADQNACEPNRTRSMPTERASTNWESASTLRRGYVRAHTNTLTRMRAHTHLSAHMGASVAHAHIGDPIL